MATLKYSLNPIDVVGKPVQPLPVLKLHCRTCTTLFLRVAFFEKQPNKQQDLRIPISILKNRTVWKALCLYESMSMIRLNDPLVKRATTTFL